MCTQEVRLWLTVICPEHCGVLIAFRFWTTQIAVLAIIVAPHVTAWSAIAETTVVTAFAHPKTGSTCAGLDKAHTSGGTTLLFRVARQVWFWSVAVVTSYRVRYKESVNTLSDVCVLKYVIKRNERELSPGLNPRLVYNMGSLFPGFTLRRA